MTKTWSSREALHIGQARLPRGFVAAPAFRGSISLNTPIGEKRMAGDRSMGVPRSENGVYWLGIYITLE